MTDNELLLALSDMIDKKLDAKLQPLQKDITDIKSDVTNMQDDITDIKVQLNQIDSNIIKTRQQVLREVKRLNNITDAAFEDIGRIDTKVEQHINNKHTA